MRLGVHIGYRGLGLSAAEQLELVQEAERLGYDSRWTAEAYGSDAVAIRAWMAAREQNLYNERLSVFREAGVGALMVSPMAWSLGERREQLRLVAELTG